MTKVYYDIEYHLVFKGKLTTTTTITTKKQIKKK